MAFFKCYLTKTGIGILGKVCCAGNYGGIWCNGKYTLVPSPIKTAGNGAKKNIPRGYHGMCHIPGGWGGIRTPGGVAPTTVFKTVAIDRSATHPELHHTAGLSNLRRGLKTLAIIQCLERIVNLSVMLIIILANPDARVIIITGEAT